MCVYMCTLVSSARRGWDRKRQPLELQCYVKKCHLLDCGTELKETGPRTHTSEGFYHERSLKTGWRARWWCRQRPLSFLPASRSVSQSMVGDNGCFVNAWASNVPSVQMQSLTRVRSLVWLALHSPWVPRKCFHIRMVPAVDGRSDTLKFM